MHQHSFTQASVVEKVFKKQKILTASIITECLLLLLQNLLSGLAKKTATATVNELQQ